MQLELSLRAEISRDLAKGEWKERLEEILHALAVGDNPFSTPPAPSPRRPNVFLAEEHDHFLVFQRYEGKVRVMDIMLKPEES
ncbi:hypothetical protein GJ699_30920 [Duganella sp. FT80W]|uniref:Uncharacterized protein n=1 Tax=Duganella guangzhouensis TaxID=2666084 RepID=A0A6I2LC56_9BURK|nr:hypothetical protein [Duganella guangzhouensis]MRW94394.1 hypothetical protein [Duganella guangzhouensis]